jgi:hypothetical protein
MPQRLTLFSGEQATEANSIPLSGGMGEPRIPYTELGAQLHNSIGDSQERHGGKNHHKDKSNNQIQHLGSQDPLGTNPLSKWRGK